MNETTLDTWHKGTVRNQVAKVVTKMLVKPRAIPTGKDAQAMVVGYV